ncbi:hypothetical protein CI610_01418 [invertebrate metagenome]|uniref:Uncharacterized protein n=1 Tax=invertebrate metagenome TaxID=1711999 RepID=A0A2H9T8U1_9ZZZZ
MGNVSSSLFDFEAKIPIQCLDCKDEVQIPAFKEHAHKEQHNGYNREKYKVFPDVDTEAERTPLKEQVVLKQQVVDVDKAPFLIALLEADYEKFYQSRVKEHLDTTAVSYLLYLLREGGNDDVDVKKMKTYVKEHDKYILVYFTKKLCDEWEKYGKDLYECLEIQILNGTTAIVPLYAEEGERIRIPMPFNVFKGCNCNGTDNFRALDGLVKRSLTD